LLCHFYLVVFVIIFTQIGVAKVAILILMHNSYGRFFSANSKKTCAYHAFRRFYVILSFMQGGDFTVPEKSLPLHFIFISE
jgi:hypothetical protein